MLNKKIIIYIVVAVVALAAYFLFGRRLLTTNYQLPTGTPDFSKFENQSLPPPAALSGRQVYQILSNPKFTPRIAGVIIDPVNAAGGGTQNIYVLMASDILPTSTPTLPPGTAAKIGVISPTNIHGYVSVADGKSPEIRADLTAVSSSSADFSVFGSSLSAEGYVLGSNFPYSVDASGTVVFAPSPSQVSQSEISEGKRIPAGKAISVLKTEVELPKAFGAANRFFISVSDAAGRMRAVAINRQTSCEYPNGGDWAPDTECNLSYVGGVDNGNLNLSSETSLTLDAQFAVNPGKAMNISGLGSLAVNVTNGGLKKGYIWRAFEDKTGSAQKIGDSPSQVLQSKIWEGYYRRYLFPNTEKFQPKGKFGMPETKTTYSVTENDAVWPKIYQAVIDPPDVHVGDTQNLGIVVQAEAGQKITSVVAEIETDKETVKLPLKLEGETAKADIAPNPYYVDGSSRLAIRTPEEIKALALQNFAPQNLGGLALRVIPAYSAGIQNSAYAASRVIPASAEIQPSVIPAYSAGIQNSAYAASRVIPASAEIQPSVIPAYSAGIQNVAYAVSSPKYTYSGSWVVKDTHDTKYHTTFIVTDSSGRVNRITLAWSDACSIPGGGNWTISAACALASNDGVDNGSVTISGGWTLTINAGVSFSFNPGQSITIAAGSSIVLSAGTSQIVKNYVYYTDADGDGYSPAGGVATYSTALSIAGNTRRYLLGGGPYSGSSVDCYDSNAAAKPGQISYFTTNRGDLSFDYNCNGITDYRPNPGSSFASAIDAQNCGNTSGCGTPSSPQYYGWCGNPVLTGPGGISYPYCAGGGSYPGCGVHSNYYVYNNPSCGNLCATFGGVYMIGSTMDCR